MTISTVTIVGAGYMGGGIAQVLAIAGFDVTIVDAGISKTLEVDVVIDERAADARASYAPNGAVAQGITYVGTPSGLKSLIEDVYAAEVADAIVLRPVGGARTKDLIATLLAA